MYRYDEFDAAFVKERTAQFRDQVMRRAARRDQRGPVPAAAADERALSAAARLHVPDRHSLRHAARRGSCASSPTSRAPTIAATATSRRAPTSSSTGRSCSDVPDIIAHLNEVEMHSIQTSGNCIRNISTDQFAGAAADEIIDPRPVAEILRQWSSLHPEFSYLPRKFKIAMTGGAERPRGDQVPRHRPQGGDQRRRRDRLGSLGRRRARPHADDRQADPAVRRAREPARLSREHPARLQPLRPARQQVQGAHQDPRARDRHRQDPRGGRGRVSPRSRAAC